jgi:hypothetical protein
MSDIVPFGKYRGQPVEALAADRDYCDWLMAQAWFRDRYQNIYTIVINNQQPTETPEHNALQVLFLDEAYRLAFLRTVYTLDETWAAHLTWRANRCAKLRNEIEAKKSLVIAALEHEETMARIKARWEAIKRGEIVDDGKDDEIPFTTLARPERYQAELDELTQTLRAEEQPESMVVETEVEFERRGIDVFMTAAVRSSLGGLVERVSTGIEIKPSVGDDYPAVLRQMAALDRAYDGICRFLFLEKYTGVGATEQQFRKVFAASGKRVVFRHEVERLL